MKLVYEFIITITLLTNSGESIRVETNGESCHNWFDKNTIEKEYLWKIGREKITYHEYKGKVIVGYLCSNKLGA
jgi:hypothetical protein